MKTQRHQALLLVCLLLLLVPAMVAQVDTGAIVGTVRDSSNAVIPGASVTITNQNLGVSSQTNTNSEGNYQFPALRIGTYTLLVAAPGFASTRRENIVLGIQQRFNADFTLSPSSVATEVNVTAEAAQLQTQEASLGSTIQSQTINDLPLNGRNYTFLAQLSPGVIQGPQDARGFGATGSFAANGRDIYANNYLLDGVDNNSNVSDYINGSTYLYRPSVDALQEFKVQTSSYSAEFGRAGGAIINATIKSGTERYHGGLFEFHRNAALDANYFFNNFAGQPKGKFLRNQFGGTFGGPVPLLNRGSMKTFFFVDYEGTTQRQAQTFQLTTPTTLMQQSNFTNFSELLTQGGTNTDRLGRMYAVGTIFDPATTRLVQGGTVDPVTGRAVTGTGSAWVRDPIDPSCTPLASAGSPNPCLNRIPANRINADALKLFKLFPAPQTAGIIQNYTSSPLGINWNHQGDFRIDQYAGSNDTLFFRFSKGSNFNQVKSLWPGPLDGTSFNDSPTAIQVHSEVASWTRVWSQATVSEVRFGYSVMDLQRTRNNGTDYITPTDFGFVPYTANPGFGGIPRFVVTGLGNFGPSSWVPTYTRNATPQFSGLITRLMGAHSLKVGGQWLRPYADFYQPQSPSGEYRYAGTFTDMPNTTGGNTGVAQVLINPIANPYSAQFPTTCGFTAIGGTATAPCRANFVGGPDQVFVTKDPGLKTIPKAIWQIWSGFAEDTWKTTPKLTLTLGLRYEYLRNSDAPDGRGSNFLVSPTPTLWFAKDGCNDAVSPAFLAQLASNGITKGCADNNNLVKSPRTMFAPRFGLAYNATSKWVIRLGGGLFYQTSYRSNILSQFRTYPYEYNVSLNNLSPGEPVVYANGTTATFNGGVDAVGVQDPTTFNPLNTGLAGYTTPQRAPRTAQYNLTVQRQVSTNQTVSAGYVGNITRQGFLSYNFNSARVIAPPGTSATSFRQFKSFSSANQSGNGANGNYNSLQLTYERRFTGSLSARANYTFSKCLTETREIFTAADVGSSGRNIWLLGADRALCSTDAPHSLSASSSFSLPFGRGKQMLGNASGIVNQIVGGWRGNLVFLATSGYPVTIPCTITTTSGSGCNALLTGQPLYPENRTFNQWWNPAAFTNPPAATTLGQTDLSPLGGAPAQIRAPYYRRADLSFFKEFPVKEAQKFEFRAEFFNITNTPNFSAPGFTGGDAGVQPPPGVRSFNNKNFGRITSMRNGQNDERQVQLALKYYF
jgi:hypothetical protein